MLNTKLKHETEDLSVREKLLSSAIDLFANKGYAASTVREIVTAAGVTKPVLYYYFRNKEGLYLELMGGTFAKFESLLDSFHLQEGSAKAKILQFADRIFDLYMDNIEVARVMYAIYYGPPQGAPFFDFEIYHSKLEESIRKMINAGMHTGEFRKGSVEDMKWAILGALHVAMELELCRPEVEMGREGLARLINVIFKGLDSD